MMRIFWESRGSTVTEQLMAALFGLIVMGTLYGFYREQLFNLLSQEAKTATLEDARGALDIMVRDLRNAGSWGEGTVPLEKDSSEDPKNIDDPNNDADTVCNRVHAATEKLLIVQMDLNGDGDCMDYPDHPTASHRKDRETIKYELTGPTKTCPGPNIIRRNDDCLVANVVTPFPEKLFTYYDSNHGDLGDNPPLESIKRVKITFAVQVSNPNPKISGTVTSTLSSSVEFRN
ncbi:MAG: PilW family protein [Candidatus Binatia bacterium]